LIKHVLFSWWEEQRFSSCVLASSAVVSIVIFVCHCPQDKDEMIDEKSTSLRKTFHS